MKLILISALVAVLGLASASTPLPAQTTTTTALAAPAKKAKTNYTGTITAVDATSITIQAAKGPMTLAITPTTKYKGATAITDFAVGDKVTGSYSKDASGTMTAASVHKKAAKGAAPAAQ